MFCKRGRNYRSCYRAVVGLNISRRRSLWAILSGITIGVVKGFVPSIAFAQRDLPEPDQSDQKIETAYWHGLHIPAGTVSPKRPPAYLNKILGIRELRGAKVAFNIMPDSRLFVNRVQQDKKIRIYVKAGYRKQP